MADTLESRNRQRRSRRKRGRRRQHLAVSGHTVILHGTWPVVSQPGHDLMLWAEVGSSRHRRGDNGLHPFHLTQRELARLWSDLAKVQPPLGGLSNQPRIRGYLLLPSLGTRPLASHHTLLGEAEAQGEGDWYLGRWLVEGVGLSPLQVTSILPFLPDGRIPTHPNILVGDDLRFWKTLGMYLVELLTRDRYLPRFIADPDVNDGRFYVLWRAFLDRLDTERLKDLAGAMPPSALADRSAFGPNGAGKAMKRYMASALDTLVRLHARRKVSLSRSSKGRSTREPILLRPALIAGEAVTGIRPELVEMQQKLDSWVANLANMSGELVSVCFKLDPPVKKKSRKGGKAAKEVWWLGFYLQDVGNPDALLPAEEIFACSEASLDYKGRSFDAPQEKLLAGLGRAGRLFPPLEKCLAEATPTGTSLSREEAYLFLTDAAPSLMDGGFAVVTPDFSRTRLGVKLILRPNQDAAVGGSFGLRMIVKYRLELLLGGEAVSFEELERLAGLKVPLVQVGDDWTMIDHDDIKAALALMEGRSDGQIELGHALRLALSGEERMRGLLVMDVEATEWLAGMVGALTGTMHPAATPQPTGLVGTLRPYQLVGLSWLAFLEESRLGGCLADDMGLGKTIQVIALLLLAKERGAPLLPTLIICPTSVMTNWHRELSKFAPDLSVMKHHGGGRLDGDSFAAASGNHDVVLTTYSLLQRETETFERVHWACIVLDEAQNVKNPRAKQSKAARTLSGSFRIALTGTPVENRLSELWSIMEFLNPGFLGSEPDFRQSFAIPIERYRQRERGEQLRRIVSPVILRRSKSDTTVIGDLPLKMEMKVFVDLTEEQEEIYEGLVKEMMARVERSAGIERKGLVLATLTKLKQVCNHPLQVLKDGSEISGRSGKLSRVTEMLEEALDEGDRALVFTQFKEMGDLLVAHLAEQLGAEVLFLHGGVPERGRVRMIDDFQSDDGPPIFVLSLKAGGLGLNLTRASHVFHYDRWWNPAVENQATDRAFRIGQQRNVQVHKFICAGTLEERIDAMIERKKGLAELVVNEGESWLSELSTEELRELVELRSGGEEGQQP